MSSGRKRGGKINSIGELIDQLARLYHFDKKIKENEVIVKWNEIAGSTIAAATEPIRVKDGILYLKVKNDVWRNELHYQKLDLLKNIQKTLKARIITEIIFL